MKRSIAVFPNLNDSSLPVKKLNVCPYFINICIKYKVTSVRGLAVDRRMVGDVSNQRGWSRGKVRPQAETGQGRVCVKRSEADPGLSCWRGALHVYREWPGGVWNIPHGKGKYGGPPPDIF